MVTHDGHRERLKARFQEEGLDNFSEINALELLLTYVIPRQDVNPLAHNLLEYFGSFPKVLESSPEELMQVKGVGKNTALFLSLLNQTGRYYQVRRQEMGTILRNTEEYGSFLAPFFYGRGEETVYMLCLDAKCKVICCSLQGVGSVNSASISIPRMVSQAVTVKATSVILAHNHPSGIAVPSPEDEATTVRVLDAMNTVEIRLIDHLIFADGDYVSLAQSHRLKPYL